MNLGFGVRDEEVFSRRLSDLGCLRFVSGASGPRFIHIRLRVVQHNRLFAEADTKEKMMGVKG